jgi:hypothetical protein
MEMVRGGQEEENPRRDGGVRDATKWKQKK